MSDVITNSLLVLIRERGLGDEQDLEAVQGEHNLSGESVSALLAKGGLVDVPTQLELIAEYLGTDVLDLSEIEFTEDLVSLMPLDMAKQYQCVPIGLDGEVMHLSMVDPLNPTVLDELAFQLNRPLQVRVADPNQIEKILEEKYSGEATFEDLIEEIGGFHLPDVEDDPDKITSLEILEEVGDDMPIVRFVNMVLYQSLKDSASDIHFEPFEDTFQIRMKVDGTMKLLTPPPRELAPAISSRLKIMANLNIAERRLPQDGRIATIIAGEELVFRMSTLPTQFGESVVLRLLDKNNTDILSLDVLKIPDKVHKSIIHCVEQPNGVFLVTGPTGSGKTTTLYAALRRLNKIDVKIITAEDPVEFPVEGIVQCQIQESMGMTFAKALRSFLRQDPDIILVGETRDLETAAITIEAALTGHLVVTTLHTNSSTEAITRLVDMGVEPFLIASSVNGALAQRLVKTICPKCIVSTPITKDQRKMLQISDEDAEGKEIKYGTGCDFCNNSGYKGRCGLYEMLQMSDEVRELIANKVPALVLREKAMEFGMQTLRMDGLRVMFAGDSTFEEVMKYT
ncbi:MAG TPA: type II/IV secretion system protein [Verrucomicrobia bacterium]|nr:type II/IV secretion system protein [Verrucomicrobiota bacterium]